MSPDKQNLLYARYPDLFREKGLPMTESCLYWGLQCDDGWYNIIDSLCARLTLVKRYTGLDVAISSLKEKFATLRVYPTIEAYPIDSTEAERDHWSGVVRAIIADAEQRSAQTCETTGRWGILYRTPGGWLKTLNPAEAAKDVGRGWVKVERGAV